MGQESLPGVSSRVSTSDVLGWPYTAGGGGGTPPRTPSPPHPSLPMFEADSQNHLEERLLDRVQARTPYTPLLGSHSRSIPQGMILDVQPLVKSLFCPTKESLNGFVDFETSIPLKLDTFLGWVGGGGGQKSVVRRI